MIRDRAWTDEEQRSAEALLREVLEDSVWVGPDFNACVFCGRWPDNHEADCLTLRIRELLAEPS